ncbi:MAG TPA: hypothetical protein PLG23_15285 [Thermoflexales bacterium]|jgi:hypothetical protein|nr:hypothetical protein [Anaerolineae bacterium]HQV29497.1 hypothetical protein [Thermoflexales bacterium]HQX11835.1 hypothetical protein [Thermoflexales bacterium]HQY25931.1 hypothetical protein [Thermoflexales bacterium]HQZ54827.1 hypothetical protein [Thermoflexales bacterium]
MAFTLKRDSWKTFKTQNNLSKSSWFSKADVGPTIDKFWAAKDLWDKAWGMTSLRKFFTAATNLQAAFDKFIKLKVAKGEMSETVRSQIATWKQEIDVVVRMLADANQKSQKELLEADAIRLRANLKKEGLM